MSGHDLVIFDFGLDAAGVAPLTGGASMRIREEGEDDPEVLDQPERALGLQ